MGKQEDRAAEQLTHLLQAAHFQQLTGLLRIESRKGRHREEGELYFLAGQPISARTGKLRGQEALNLLLTWRSLRYSFTPDAPKPQANLAATHPPAVSLEQVIPRKINLEQHVPLLLLTHRQRTVYFLIDGKRTIADLARITGKTVEEVASILQELERRSIVVV